MGIGTSLFLIAVGAILKFAVTDIVSGVELATVGVILMVVGILGLLISLLSSLQARDRGVVRDRVVDRRSSRLTAVRPLGARRPCSPPTASPGSSGARRHSMILPPRMRNSVRAVAPGRVACRPRAARSAGTAR